MRKLHKHELQPIELFFFKFGFGIVRTEDNGALSVLWGKTDNVIEVESKVDPVRYQKGKQWSHGIEIPRCEAHDALEKDYGVRVYLCIHQKRKGDTPADPTILIQARKVLREVRTFRSPDPGTFYGMEYWDVYKFSVCVSSRFEFEMNRARLTKRDWEFGTSMETDINLFRETDDDILLALQDELSPPPPVSGFFRDQIRNETGRR